MTTAVQSAREALDSERHADTVISDEALSLLAEHFFRRFKESLFRARTVTEWERDADARFALICKNWEGKA